MRILLTLIFWLTCVNSYAQCVPGEIKVLKDSLFPETILVETEYFLNGVRVDVNGEPSSTWVGQNRFKNHSGTDEEIIAKAKRGINEHCKNLIKRITENETFIQDEVQKRHDELQVGRTADSIITNIKDEIEGYTVSITEATKTFRGKDIKVTYDKKNTVTDSVLAIE